MRKTLFALLAGCAHTVAPPTPLALHKVILYQNGIGYFEREGHLAGGALHLAFARPDLDDVLKTLTVIDRLGSAIATVDVPRSSESDRTVGLDVRLSAGRAHDLLVGYAVPTPTWKAAYRVVLADHAPALLQAWAMVNNTSQDDWNGVALTLATGAPMSFALDLHTPAYVKRPDATGHMIAPTVLGPLDDEHARAPDRDADGIPDEVDKCPDDPAVGGAGGDDGDGCPTRGRVVLTESNLVILRDIEFARGGDALSAAAAPIVDAVVATLKGNPDIKLLELGGHAAPDEPEVWALSTRRAVAVRAALVDRGIEASRLRIAPYGATQPLGGKDGDRRVGFLIVTRGEEHERLSAKHVQASTRAATKPAAVAGSVRYVVTEPVTIKRDASAMVSILNRPITGEDVLLFRPDGNAPGSAQHPFRAVRLVNTSGFTLEPGPIAIFAHGTFVGDSLVQRLDLGETAWIPYALDGATTISVENDDAQRPARIIAIHRGVLTVEDIGSRTTTYKIDAGRDAGATLYLRHDKLAGFTPKALPPGAIDRGGSYLIPLPLAPGKHSTLAIEETQPRRRTLSLLDLHGPDLGLYVEGSQLPPELRAKVAAAVARRKELALFDAEVAALRIRIGDTTARADELRENLKTIDRVHGADELRKRLIASLVQATADADAIARKLGVATEGVSAARTSLQEAVRDVVMD